MIFQRLLGRALGARVCGQIHNDKGQVVFNSSCRRALGARVHRQIHRIVKDKNSNGSFKSALEARVHCAIHRVQRDWGFQLRESFGSENVATTLKISLSQENPKKSGIP